VSAEVRHGRYKIVIGTQLGYGWPVPAAVSRNPKRKNAMKVVVLLRPARR
jgi:hypothetical protein